MIFMADTSHPFAQVVEDIGLPVEQLLTPNERSERGSPMIIWGNRGKRVCDIGGFVLIPRVERFELGGRITMVKWLWFIAVFDGR